MQLPPVHVDTKGLTEPATKLIECVSKAIGKLYEPTGIVRKAKAERGGS